MRLQLVFSKISAIKEKVSALLVGVIESQPQQSISYIKTTFSKATH